MTFIPATTKEIKRALVKGFNHKFSVRKGKGTASHWVHISWTDGPTSAMVDGILNNYNDDARDDSMTDLWCGSQYTQSSRSYSPEAYEIAVKRACEKWGLEIPEIKEKFGCVSVDDQYIEDASSYLLDLIHRERVKIDYRPGMVEMSDRFICSICGEKLELSERNEYNGQEMCFYCMVKTPEYIQEKAEEKKTNDQSQKDHESLLEKLTFQPISIIPSPESLLEYFLEPEFNKICSLNEAKECKTRQVRGKIIETVTLTAGDFDLFSENMTANYTWLAKKGGTDSTIDYPETKEFHQMTEEQRKTWIAASFELYIKVTAEDRPPIFVNPQGYNYARYIAFQYTGNVISFKRSA